MNNPIKPTKLRANQSTSLSGIKVTTIIAMSIIEMFNNKSSFMGNSIAQNLKELNKRN